MLIPEKTRENEYKQTVMNNLLSRTLTVILCFFLQSTLAHADAVHAGQAHYLGNAGVMVERGQSKVLFDPFFRNDYGVYDLVPEEIERAIFAGSPPYDGIDAVFVSHHHDDHFDAKLLVAYLETWQEIELYAPQQAVDMLLASVQAIDETVLDRIHGLAMESAAEPVKTRAGELLIEAVEVAHAGWPSRNTEVDNLAFRVTIDSSTTIVHMGDADKATEHYEPHREYWEARKVQLAFAPVWLFLTDQGLYVLDDYVGADHQIGVHVYDRVPDDPDDRPAEFDGLDIFTEPGEVRSIE